MVKTSDALIIGAIGLGALFLIKKPIGEIFSGVGDITQGIGSGVSIGSQGLGQGFSDVAGGISEAVTGLGGGISVIGEEVGDSFTNIGRVGDALTDNVVGGIERVGEITTNIFRQRSKKLKSIPKPKVVTQAMKDINKNLPIAGTKSGSVVLDNLFKNSQPAPIQSIFNQSISVKGLSNIKSKNDIAIDKLNLLVGKTPLNIVTKSKKKSSLKSAPKGSSSSNAAGFDRAASVAKTKSNIAKSKALTAAKRART